MHSRCSLLFLEMSQSVAWAIRCLHVLKLQFEFDRTVATSYLLANTVTQLASGLDGNKSPVKGNTVSTPRNLLARPVNIEVVLHIL